MADAKKIWRDLREKFGAWIDARCVTCAAAVTTNSQTPEMNGIRCNHDGKKMWVWTRNHGGGQTKWNFIRERPAEVGDGLCLNKRCNDGSKKCRLAHSDAELHVWKMLCEHRIFVHHFLQKLTYEKEELPADVAVTEPSKSKKKERHRMRNRGKIDERNSVDNNLGRQFKLLLRNCGGGRFLFVCQNCYSLDPRIIIEMEIGIGKSSKLRCNWCVRGRELLLHETIMNNDNEVTFYEYEVIRNRMSTTKGNALCRFQPNCPKSETCTYAHSYLELQVWKLETNDVSRMDLVKFCNRLALNDRPTLDGMFHCDLCCLSFSNYRQYLKYMMANHEHFPEIRRSVNTWVFPKQPTTKRVPYQEKGIDPWDNRMDLSPDEYEHKEWEHRKQIADARSKFVLKQETESPTYEPQQRLQPIHSKNKVVCEVDDVKEVIKLDTKTFKWKMKIAVEDDKLKLTSLKFPYHREFKIRQIKEERYEKLVEFNDQDGPIYEFMILFTNPLVYGKHVGDLFFEFNDEQPPSHLRFEVDIIGESIDMPVWKMEDSDWTQNRIVIKHPEFANHVTSYEKQIEELKIQYKMPKTVGEWDLQHIVQRNYANKMHALLFSEEKARENVLSRMNLKCDLEVKSTTYDDGHLLAVFSIPISASTDEGVLFRESCSTVYIGEEDDKYAFECTIKSWNNEEILISLPLRCVEGLGINPGHTSSLHIQFRLDRSMFCLRHYAVDNIRKKASLICPSANDYARLKYDKIGATCEGLDDIQTVVFNYLHLEKEKWPRNSKKSYPPLIVAGPFGTGKTHTIKAILFDLLRRGESTILLCTHSNSAADLYLEDQRMQQWKNKILRLVYHGRDPRSVKETVRDFCLFHENRFCYPSLEELRKYRLVVTTFSTALVLSLEIGLPENAFTHIFLDEASQAMEAEVIMPLLLASHENTRILLAGDHRQTTERMYCDEANQVQSLLERMYEAYENVSKKSRILLTNNYRCVDGILNLIMKLFYKENILKMAGDVQCLPDMAPVYFIHLQGRCVQTMEGEYVNQSEAYQLMLEAKNLVHERKVVQAEEVVVLSAFYQQVVLIREIFRKNRLGGISVQTVRNIQGQQYKVVMVCNVMRRIDCLGVGKNFGFLSDARLLNTALTRAQSLIVAVGDAATLCSTGHCEKHWKAYIKHCEGNGTLLPETIDVYSLKMEIKVAKQKLNISAAAFRPAVVKAPVEDINLAKDDVPQPEEDKELEEEGQNETSSDETSLDDDDNDSWCSEESEDDLILDDMIKKITGIDVGKLTVGVGDVGDEYIEYGSEDDNEDPNDMSDRPSSRRSNRREAIYPKYTVGQLEQLRRKDSKRYKRCKIQLQNWYSAKAIPLLDEMDNQTWEQLNITEPSGKNDEENSTISSNETDEDIKLHSDESEATLEVTQQPQISPANVNPVIFIETRQNLGRTFDHDEVLVEILERRTQYAMTESSQFSNQKQIGKVLGVLKKRYKNPRDLHFLCRADEFNSVFMCPIDKKLPRFAILTPKGHWQSAGSDIPIYKPMFQKRKWVDLKLKRLEKVNDQKVYVIRYLRWSEYCPYPFGYVENSFPLSDFQTYLKLEFGVPADHRNAVKKQAQQIKLPQPDRSSRPIEVFTIDPDGSMDLDDAISFEKCKDPDHPNCFEIGIHITDVASVIQEGSEIDKEAQRRFSTFYGGDQDIPVDMLPSELSNSKCSILPDEVRPAISTYFHSCDSAPHSKGYLPVTPKKTFIKSTNRLTYREAEDLLRAHMKKEVLGSEAKALAKNLYDLWQIMWEWRVSRLGGEAWYKNVDKYQEMVDECRAHLLIEEAMISVNSNTAAYLCHKNFEFPMRVQEMPDEDDWTAWKRLHANLIPNSTYLSSCDKYLKKLNRVKEGAEDSEDISEDEEDLWEEVVGRNMKRKRKKTETNQVFASIDPIDDIRIFKSKWDDMLHCKAEKDLEIFTFIAACDDLHPSLVATLDRYRGMQKKSDVISTQAAHYSLRIDKYTWSSSPIRRYIDIIIQRYIHKALVEERPTSLMDKATKRICQYYDDRHKMYEQKLRLTELAEYLKWQPIIVEACVMQITDAFIKVAIPSLGRNIQHHDRELHYGSLMASNTSKSILEGVDEKDLLRTERGQIIFSAINLVWKFTYYKYGDDSIEKCKREKLTCKIPIKEWKSFVRIISTPPRMSETKYKKEVYKCDLSEAVDNMKLKAELEEVYYSDTSCGVTQNKPIPIYHQREIKWDTFPGSSLLLQLSGSTERSRLPVPTVQMVSVTADLDVCVEHMRDPINIFACDAGITKEKGSSVKSYQRKWEPLVRMDAANGAVNENSSKTIQGVKIRWRKAIKPKELSAADILDETVKSKRRFVNYFRLKYQFCYERYIDFHEGDLLCLRLKGVPTYSPDMNDKGFSKLHGATKHTTHTAILHATITFVDSPSKKPRVNSTVDKPKITKFSDHVDNKAMQNIKVIFKQLGGRLTEEQRIFIEKPDNSWTVELISLSFVHRHMQGSLQMLGKCSELVRSICMGNIQPSPIRWDEEIDKKIVSRELTGFPFPLNTEQRKQEQRAVRDNFTLIQGPPGTGKSFMAAQIAAKFAYINREMKTDRKVLYCGPSNKSVDVAAGFLKEIQGLRVVRIYSASLEEKLYPNPLKPSRSTTESGDDGKKPDASLKSIALHEMIRARENPLSAEIKEYDSSVKSHLKSFSREEMDHYAALVIEAKKDELQKSDIIICTCSLSPLLLTNYGLEFEQCIVDECAMCSEPETILPLIMANPTQVVLIGDHKQLKPVITCNKAERLGLGVSLFSRYTEFVGMLTNQYRMHPDIMEFPSKKFYNGRLTCDEKCVLKRPKMIDPFPRSKTKAIFWDVRGEERIQHFKTAEEGHKSRYNKAEAYAVIKVLLRLESFRVPQSRIMVLSPYTAQCARIREIIRKSHGQLKDVHVGTVVTSQGSESDYVILSTVRSLPASSIMRKPNVQWLRRNLGFLTDPNQVNVALTRARRRLFIIGNKNLLRVGMPWNALLESYERKGAVVDHWPF